MNRKHRNTRKMAQRNVLRILASRMAIRKALEAKLVAALKAINEQMFGDPLTSVTLPGFLPGGGSFGGAQPDSVRTLEANA